LGDWVGGGVEAYSSVSVQVSENICWRVDRNGTYSRIVPLNGKTGDEQSGVSSTIDEGSALGHPFDNTVLVAPIRQLR
jgi:hypothetical protein